MRRYEPGMALDVGEEFLNGENGNFDPYGPALCKVTYWLEADGRTVGRVDCAYLVGACPHHRPGP